MITGVSICATEMPLSLVKGYNLKDCVYQRGGEFEYHFFFHQHPYLLPVWDSGRLLFAVWGTRRGESKKLPVTGSTWLETVQSGLWQEHETTEVIIPARMGFDHGVWFLINEGIRGIMVEDEKRMPHVYMICEPASHYYNVMTRSNRMPVLVNQRI